MSEQGSEPADGVRERREEKERRFREREEREGNGVDRSSQESFPASDPPAIPEPRDHNHRH